MKIYRLRKDFPSLNKAQGRPLVYLDSAATTQKPQIVIDTVSDFYRNGCANVHRSVSRLGEEITARYNDFRQLVASWVNAKPHEIIFTRGTTAGINFVADTWGRKFIRAGDEIILSIAEHHSNLLPWQQLAQQVGATLRFIELTDDFQFDLDQYTSLLGSKTKLVAITQASNVLGTINDLDLIIAKAKSVGAAVLIDAAQSAPYTHIDVKKLGGDFLIFSGHKMLGLDGIGVLYIDQKWHDQILPYQLGGGMVSNVMRDTCTFLPAPEKFEAGTMPIGSILSLGAAINYYQQNIDWVELEKHLASLCEQLIVGFEKLPQIRVVGCKSALSKRGHLVSFVVDGYHAHDVAAYLDQYGICVRAGHHCAQPLHDYLGLPATVRVSFQVYNTAQEVELVLNCLKRLVENGLIE